MSDYYKKQNEAMAQKLKQIASTQDRYIPPRFRVEDPVITTSESDHPMFITTAKDYGLNPANKKTQVARFPKSNKFSRGLIGKNYTDNSLNTSSDKDSTYASTSLSF